MKPAILILTTGALLAAAPALAHHPLGGEAPQSIVHGVLSGLAHPVIGIDHLAFVVLAGLAAAIAGRGLSGPLAFILATLAGTFIQLGGIALPLAELVIAGSVVVLGALLVMGRQVGEPAALGGFALAGLFHGWAYGEAVVGSTPMPIVAYLAGFAVIQFAIAAGVARLGGRLLARPEGALQARLAAAVCAGVGLAFLVEAGEHLILG
ncbi:MAG: HupE/UreJ family protein [Pararhodobacter sp.]